MQQAAVELKFSSVAEVGLPYPVDVVFNCLKSSMYFLPLLHLAPGIVIQHAATKR